MAARNTRPLLLACTFALLAACGGRQGSDAQSQDGRQDGLPKPEQDGGSITGMPAKPGPGEVPLSGKPPPAAAPETPVDLLNPNPESGMLPGDASAGPGAPAAEPSAQDAVAVIRDYYASIDGRSYARAYALWANAGQASGQTPQQFADGFAGTAKVGVEIGTPGNEDAGAGQRYIQVPVAITATQSDGSVRRYDGTYTLHRTVVDGASAEQRAWRIQSADLRELKP
ncbi:hypothetical protein [Luteimonas aquatica]|uniref:hypothetical protein n=1 Tax=Luteimonas aquatica TaxID=450364 RepID=UPI001F5AA5F7|nr:hypothetical protein [Luteimonas aquatica]